MLPKAPFCLTAALCAAIFMFAGPAVGQEPQSRGRVCALHDKITDALKDRWGERQIGLGINNEGALVEVYVNPNNGSFTILLTRPDGWSCVATAGKDWRKTIQKPKGPEL